MKIGNDIKIFDSDGKIKDALSINDEIDFSVVDGRVLKGTKCYYKGIGVPYSSHFIPVMMRLRMLTHFFQSNLLIPLFNLNNDLYRDFIGAR